MDRGPTEGRSRPSAPLFAASIHGQAGAACVDCHADLAKAELPHAEKLARVDCSPCHAKEAEELREELHAEARRNAPSKAAVTCASCHGTHDILPSKDPKSRTNHFNVPATCLACHGNTGMVFPAAARLRRPARRASFGDSIHGAAL